MKTLSREFKVRQTQSFTHRERFACEKGIKNVASYRICTQNILILPFMLLLPFFSSHFTDKNMFEKFKAKCGNSKVP
jgi:hypothetical protein